MNVLHLIDTFGTGGAESVFLQLVGGLDESRFRSHAAVLGRGWVPNSLRAIGIDPIFTPSSRSLDVPYLGQLVRIIRSRQIDIVQTHLLTTALYGAVAGKICGVPVVSTFHGVRDINSSHLAVKSWILGRAVTRLVFVSESLRHTITGRTGLPNEKCATIYNGVDTQRFAPRADRSLRAELGIADDETLVGGVGRLVDAKGFDVMIQAANKLRDHPAKFRFVIVGEALPRYGTDEALRALRDSLGLQEVVSFIPFRQDIERVFNGMDIFALSSRTEGFSLTTIEAMASGLPVVVTKSGGPQEIVTPGKDGLMVAPEDSDGLARELSRLACDRVLSKRLASEARSVAVRRFSLTTTLRQYEDLYESLCERVEPSVADSFGNLAERNTYPVRERISL